MGSTPLPNKWIWSKEVHENFTVKSAYRILLNDKLLSIGESSSASTYSPFWKELWKLKIPLKIQVFAWKACKEGLPTTHNLVKRHVNVNNKCCFCSQSLEDVLHALFLCDELQPWWDKYLSSLSALPNIFFYLACWLSHHINEKDLDKFFCVAWCIWSRRNHMIFEGEC